MVVKLFYITIILSPVTEIIINWLLMFLFFTKEMEINRIEEDAAYRVKMLFQIISYWQCFSALVEVPWHKFLTILSYFETINDKQEYCQTTVISGKKELMLQFVTDVLFNLLLMFSLICFNHKISGYSLRSPEQLDYELRFLSRDSWRGLVSCLLIWRCLNVFQLLLLIFFP